MGGLSNYLALKYVPAPQTMFAGIQSLPPGHSLTCDADGVQIRRYWDLTFVNQPDRHISEHDYAEQLLDLLQQTIVICAAMRPLALFSAVGLIPARL